MQERKALNTYNCISSSKLDERRNTCPYKKHCQKKNNYNTRDKVINYTKSLILVKKL